MDRPGPQERGRLKDSDRSLNGRVEPAWNVQPGEYRPAQSRDRSLERRRPERRHRQFERPVPCLAGAKVNIARNLDWLEDEILAGRFRMGRWVAVGIRCGDLVLPVLDRAKRHDECAGVNRPVRPDAHLAPHELARKECISIQLEAPIDAVARIVEDSGHGAMMPDGPFNRPRRSSAPESYSRDTIRETLRRLTMLNLDIVQRAPKALLHDHLDGGLRPETIVDLAAEYGYKGLPTTDPDDLAAWIRRGADRKSLELYLETFVHTVGVLQERDAIVRVAAECAEDLAADGVVYAEVRYAPELSTERKLTLDEVIEANVEGFRIGSERATGAGHPIAMKILVTAMRQAARSVEVAEAAIRWRDAGVVGFDIAGPEAGYRPTRHLEAFDRIRHENFHITIHAGESFGLPSIWEALQFCGAERLGHGTRIVDDITVEPDGTVRLGRLAAFVRDRRVPLEMCPTSNVHSGAVGSVSEHPIDLLRRLRFRVTLNTDNRLMSGVTVSSEFAALDAAFGIGLGEMEWLTINALKSAFAPFDERLTLINEVVKPGYAHLRAEDSRAIAVG